MYYIPQQILGSLWLVFICVGNVMSVGLAWYVWVAAVYVVGIVCWSLVREGTLQVIRSCDRLLKTYTIFICLDLFTQNHCLLFLGITSHC